METLGRGQVDLQLTCFLIRVEVLVNVQYILLPLRFLLKILPVCARWHAIVVGKFTVFYYMDYHN